MVDRLIQARVPAGVADSIKAAAQAEGDTIAGFLRRRLVLEFGDGWFPALMAPLSALRPGDGLRGRPPNCGLQLLRRYGPTELLCSVHDVHRRAPTKQMLETMAGGDFAFVMTGAPTIWRVAASLPRGRANLEAVLRADPL